MKKQIVCSPVTDINEIQIVEDNVKLEYSIKMIIIGEPGVGKTSIALKGKCNFDNKYQSTIYFEHSWKNFNVNDTIIRIQIWDTCGQELYHSVVKHFYQECRIALLVFSINDINSFEKCDNWLKELRENAGNDIIIFLIGNKADLNRQRVISKEIIEQYVIENKIDCYEECSAKTGEGVDKIFKECVKEIYNKYIVPLMNHSSDRSDTICSSRSTIDLTKPRERSNCKECLCCAQY